MIWMGVVIAEGVIAEKGWNMLLGGWKSDRVYTRKIDSLSPCTNDEEGHLDLHGRLVS